MKISKHVSPYVDENFFRKSKHDTITLRLISSWGCNLIKKHTVHYVSNEFVDMQRGLDWGPSIYYVSKGLGGWV